MSFQALEAAGFSAGNGLGMGVSPIANCLDKVLRALPALDGCPGRENWAFRRGPRE